MKRFLAILLAAMLLASGLTAALAEETLPTTWDLSEIYESEEAWNADYDAVMEMLAQYEQYRGKLNDAQTIYDYLQFGYYTELTRIQQKLSAYAMLGSSLDSTDPVFSRMNAKLDALDVKESQLTAFATPEIFALPLETREEIFSDPLFEDYAYAVKDYTDPDEQPLGEEAQEALATLSMALGYPYQAFERLAYVEMPHLSLTLPDGTEREMTEEAYCDVIYSDEYSDELKAEASRLFNESVKPYINTFAKLLEGNASENYASALLDRKETTRAWAMDASDVDPAVYDMLIEAAHAGASDNQRYLKAHARGLGLEEQYSYHMGTYVSDYNPGKTDYDAAVAEVVEALGVLGDEYVETFKSIISSGHVDVYPTDTKTTGAFESQQSYDSLPWVLFNYNGLSDDISTIAHEMGHAVYDAFATANQPMQYRSPGSFTQEVASTTNELLYYSYKMANAADDDEKLYYLENVLSMINGTFFGQMLFAEFEDDFYKIVESGDALDAEALSDRYAELLEQYDGDALKRVPESRYRWAVVPHFYYGYYVYQYASSVSYAASIAQRITRGEEGAVGDYLAFLKAGRSDDPQALLSIAGIDPLAQSTYDDAMAYFSGLVDEYERLVDEKLAAKPAA